MPLIPALRAEAGTSRVEARVHSRTASATQRSYVLKNNKNKINFKKAMNLKKNKEKWGIKETWE